MEKSQADPHWREHILCDESFHYNHGAGWGGSHQTGRTNMVAEFLQPFTSVDPQA